MTRCIGIDPSTKTGFVALDASGKILRNKELTGVGGADPKRMITMLDEIMDHIQATDFICIEGFPFSSPQAIQLGGIGWGIRMALHRRGISYIDVAPNALKKFVNVTGWEGEKGNKKRLKGKAAKQVVIDAVQQHWGFVHKSDNVNDAFVLARIALNLHRTKDFVLRLDIHDYQESVLNALWKG